MGDWRQPSHVTPECCTGPGLPGTLDDGADDDETEEGEDDADEGEDEEGENAAFCSLTISGSAHGHGGAITTRS